MNTCPYCGEEQRALKNHVRLASGDGHGPSGTYPDGFDDGASPDPPLASQNDDEGQEAGADGDEDGLNAEEDGTPSPEPEASHSPPADGVDAVSDGEGQDPPPGPESDTVEMTPDELDEMLETASSEAYDAGHRDAQTAQEQPGTESPTGGATSPNRGCPECGGALEYGNAGTRFFAVGGVVAELEEGDGLCESCDVVVGTDGEVTYGNKSKKANPAPPCGECGNGAVRPQHALHILGRYYQDTSSLRVLARRRIKKIVATIQEEDPSYVCPSCWTAYR